jgi:hypothetical protein
LRGILLGRSIPRAPLLARIRPDCNQSSPLRGRHDMKVAHCRTAARQENATSNLSLRRYSPRSQEGIHSTSDLHFDIPRLSRHCISVLSPIGTAVFGLGPGQSIRWTEQGRERRLAVLEVRAPGVPPRTGS